MVARALCVMACLMFVCEAGLALPRDRTLRQLHHTAWTAREGAPGDICCLAQTTDGTLWIGSAHGLYRFDGVQFERFAPRDVVLPSYNIYYLLASPDGGLWISFRPMGLGFLKDGRVTVWSRPEDLPKTAIYALACDAEGRIWAGTHSGLSLLSGSKWIDIGAEWNFPRERVWKMFVDHAGTLWVATSNVMFLRRGSRRFESTGVRVSAISRITEFNGQIWVAELERSVHPLVRSDTREEGHLKGFEMLFDRDGALWIIEYGRRLVRRRFPERDGNLEEFSEADGLSSNQAHTLLQDREGNIWVGTLKGLDRFRDTTVAAVALPPGHSIVTLFAGEHGDIWAGGGSSKSLDHVDGDAVTSTALPTEISCVFRQQNGDVWWGGKGGVFRQRRDDVVFFPQPKEMPRDTWMWEVVGSDDGGLWVHPDLFGLVHFKDGEWGRRPAPDLVEHGPSATFIDVQGRLWLGFTSNQVEVFDHGFIAQYGRQDGIDIGRIRVIRGRGAELWFGGELGLAVFRDGKFRSVLSGTGERFGTVSGIIETADGALWLNEMRGIIRISPEEARAAAAGASDRVRYRVFDYLDGLPGAPQMNFTVSTAVEASDGRLWFATDNGLARIDPAERRMNRIPPIVSISSVNGSPGTSLRFPVGTDKISIRYTANSLSMPERVRFRYVLEGVDRQWQDVNTRREAFYTNLRPGRYVFRVMAANQDGVWSASAASVRFELPPAFYQTRWFFVLCAVAAVIALWTAYLLRVRQVATRLRQLHAERLDERIRIAHDLHDTLLQGVLGTSMQIQALAEQTPPDWSAKPLLNRIRTRLSEVIEEGRQALRGLRASESQSLEDAFSEMKDASKSATKDFRIVVVGDRRPLDPAVEEEVYRIGREALLNAFRHAHASNVEVEIEFLRKGLLLRIRDDGRGIDPAVLQSGRENHFGIAVMRERAEKIGGRLHITSRPGAGTEVELSVPGNGEHHFWRGITISRRPNRRASIE